MVRDITTEDFVHMLNSSEEFIPFDVVSNEAREDIVIKKAVWCPVEDVDKWAVEHFDSKDEKIVIYCGGNICGSLYEAAKLLENKRFTSALNYQGTTEFPSNSCLANKPGVWV